jgi:DNA-binding LytR/AlgR family response regulator
LASIDDTDLQCESMEQVENEYHIETEIEAITSQSTQEGEQKFHDQALTMFAKWWKI